MPRNTLIDVFTDLAVTRGEFVVYDDGFRSVSRSYEEVGRAARALAARLAAAGVRQGDRIIIWGENRPEWVAALWAAIISGIVVVPIDYRSSLDFVRRIRAIVDATVILAGDDLPAEAGAGLHGEGGLDGAAVWRLAGIDWRADAPMPAVQVAAADTAEIIFTSGATAEPKGVVLTHRNILANTVPIEQEVHKYRKYGKVFFPLRFLNLLPLSHMFGQAMATFIPPMLPGTTVFVRSLSPHDIVRQIRERRISVLVSVPKMLDVLRGHVQHAAPTAAAPAGPGVHWVKRWWLHRDVHRLFGMKFWAFVVGAAPLDPDLELYWSRLGFAVIQGYGLTETAPVVTVNHPFAMRRGSVGKPIHGLKVKVAADGEILVQGDNVTQGYFNAPEATADAFEDGWLRTGDIGEVDDTGRLYVRGRKKEMIVLPDGLNVFPDDVERVLDGVPGVRESAVVGVKDGSGERVHAVLVVDPGADLDGITRAANATLADHQRVRTVSAWPGEHLPRTEGTRKLKRVEIRRWAQDGTAVSVAAPAEDPVEAVLARLSHGRAVEASTSIQELGLSSLDRVELMVALEQRMQTSIDESAFATAKTVADLRALVEGGAAASDAAPPGTLEVPEWSLSWPARAVRRALQFTLVLPLTRQFARITVHGAEHLRGLSGPIVLAANHQSHMDTPVILAALPAELRRRVAPAMAKEFFRAHFHPAEYPWRERWQASTLYFLAALVFNAFPLPQREAGARDTLRYIGHLTSAGFSILIYPEGARGETGSLKPFRPGVAMIGSRLNLPVFPVRIDGVDRVLHPSWKMARRGPVEVRFGAPIVFQGDDYASMARQLEEAVRRL
ncbi:MAG: AMP-binding protein [Vicinamibacterales bacterium]|nr:AMP-binding protein [Vicinamibacterales bacterium]